MNELKALIFDVDGTLANTEEAHRIAFNKCFADENLEWEWDVALYTKLLRVTGGKERIKHYATTYLNLDLPHEQVVRMHLAKNAYYQQMLNDGKIPLRDGVLRLINEARQKNLILAIATTTSPDNVASLVESTMGKEAMNWFQLIADGALVPVKKPAPDVYEYVLQKLHLKAEECIALEDSYNGVRAATAINIPTVITVNDYTAEDDFSGAIAVIDSLGEANRPCHVISANASINGIIDIDTLKLLHHTVNH